MLNAREKQVYELMEAGHNYQEISDTLHICVASVRTYASRVRSKIAKGELAEVEPISKVKSTPAKSIKKLKIAKVVPHRVNTWDEFIAMMSDVEVSADDSLKERVAEFKKVYCNVCTHSPYKCNQCPTTVLINKYLF